MVEVTEIYNGGFMPKQPYLNEERSRKVILFLLAFLAAYAVGFFAFAYSLDFESPDGEARTDAIIALTGEEKRVVESIRELAKGNAEKLFISGVYRGMPRDRITAATISGLKRGRGLAATKESLGARIVVPPSRAAENTIENGLESRKWVLDNKIRSIRLMTAYYHMPRSLLVFRKYMPEDVTIIPHPILLSSERPNFMSDPVLARMLFSEYNKYIVTYAWNFLKLEDSFLVKMTKDL
ncbi:MAG: YdcF family protein [Rickettsiales bacterium]|jgi:uncharacterized SAM-binding protein YcdF (DUF218 family)|nr:YdcF family protein [Rickettsiales bacterium]